MKKAFPVIIAGLIYILLPSFGCQKEGKENDNDNSVQADTVTIILDTTITYQTIDGFGFFGAQNVWWSNQDLYSQEWADKVINDLGITIWRNEYYSEESGNDTNWQTQLPVVKGLAETAQRAGVELKMIFSVWSPPSSLKCKIENDQRLSGTPHPEGLKKGGALDPAKYEDFADWLKKGIQQYKDAGVDLYAVSFQNEPLFVEPYNSCVYRPAWYVEAIDSVIPRVKETFPQIRFFGAENMLGMEGGKDRQWFYSQAISDNPMAMKYLDIWAVHGYQDGLVPTATSEHAGLWQTFRNDYGNGKPIWMTETSGYNDLWLGQKGPNGNHLSGAFDLAMTIHASLYFGHVAAWLWWQGSEMNGITDESIMQGTQKTGKKYAVCKHYFRYIRPGAKMVKVDYQDMDSVLVSAFVRNGGLTMVLLNLAKSSRVLVLKGTGIPHDAEMIVTSGSETLADKGQIDIGKISLPPESVVTLISK